MKILLALTLTLTLGLNAFAHDEGHGPKLSDAPKNGGLVSSVVLAKDGKLGTKAELKHKAELVRAEDGTLRLYFYDIQMNPLKPGVFAAKAGASLITEKKGKVNVQKFDLTWSADHFEGKMPRPARKPYNIDVKVMEGVTELLVAFDKLD